MNELISAPEGGDQTCIDLGEVQVDCLQEHVGSGRRRVWRETAGGFFLAADWPIDHFKNHDTLSRHCFSYASQ